MLEGNSFYYTLTWKTCILIFMGSRKIMYLDHWFEVGIYNRTKVLNNDCGLCRFLELKLRTSGCQGLYLTISTRDFRHSSKGFVKLAYSLTSNFPKATRVIDEADVFDREGSGWGYEEFFPLCWTEFKEQLKRTPLIITSQVSLLE